MHFEESIFEDIRVVAQQPLYCCCKLRSNFYLSFSLLCCGFNFVTSKEFVGFKLCNPVLNQFYSSAERCGPLAFNLKNLSSFSFGNTT